MAEPSRGISSGLLSLLLGFAALFGTTILGWIAVSQIRGSAGKLRGMWLAVFDGLLFPLLALTGLIARLWWWVFRDLIYPHQIDALRIDGPSVTVSKLASFVYLHWTALIVACTLMTAGSVCLFIVRRLWRAVNPPSASSRPTAPVTPRETGREPLTYAAMFFVVLSAVLGSWIWSRMLAPSAVLVFSILASALLGILLAIPVRQHPRGIQTLMIGCINLAIWLMLAIAGMGAQVKPVRAQIHTRIFEADEKLVDELVPGSTRRPGQMQDSEEAIRIEPSQSGQTAQGASRAAQTAEISADVFARLLEGGANPPGILDEQVREGT
jgi:hypothetical protein